MTKSEFVYVGIRRSDGSIRATCCDDIGEETDTAERLADWIRRGLIVERLTDVEYQRRMRAERQSLSHKTEG